MTSDGIWTYTWDYRDRLTQATNGSITMKYGYDHNNNRIWMNDGTATTTYVSKYYSLTGATTTKHIFLGNEAFATIEADGLSTSTYYLHTDHLGGTNVITDEDGAIVQLLDYYPFGGLRLDEKAGDFDEKRKYTGHEYDEATDLNYMRARYQNGGQGRFISIDPVDGDLMNPQSLNKYSYVLNNPIRMVDPLGTRATTEHETKVAMQMVKLMSESTDDSSYEMYRTAYNTYTGAIRNIPEGGGDPKSFTIINDAMFKWYDNQKNYVDWSYDSKTDSKYYSDYLKGYKCSSFVAEVLGDSVGYVNVKHKGFFSGKKYPAVSTDWVNSKVEGFSEADSPVLGDVISFDYPPGSYDHVGFYLGNGLYVSATEGSRNGAVTDGVLIKYVPYNSFDPSQINFNHIQ